jgi:hypothetical protein
MNYNTKSSLSGFPLILGLSLLGFFIFKGLKTFSDKDRVVKVKGLAEMYITAESAQIVLNFSNSGDILSSVIQKTEQKKVGILNYLKKNGYQNNEILLEDPSVTDREKYYTEEWQNGEKVRVKANRYTYGQSIGVIIKDLENAEKKSAKLKLDLVQSGLTAEISTHYKFPKLNTIKPQLIAESTKNARIAGEQFANDSQAKLGKIKTASQGQISIAGRYSYGESESYLPHIQKARVVSTIVFFLE